jgi:hypothetical protein
MAFADPLVLTVNGVAKNLVRLTSGDNLTSVYRLRGTLDQYDAKIAHKSFVDKVRGTVNRHSVEIIHTVYPVSPSTVPTIRKTYIVLEETPNDDTTAVQKFDEAFVALMTNGNITKLLNYE